MKLSDYLKQNGMTTKEYFEMRKRKEEGKTSLSDYQKQLYQDIKSTDLSDIVNNLSSNKFLDQETLSRYNDRVSQVADKVSRFQMGDAESNKSFLDNLKTLQSGISKASEYYSTFKDENDYKSQLKSIEQNKEWASADTKALKAEIDDLEGKYNSYIETKSKRDNLLSAIISGYTRAGYSREKAEQAARSDSRIAKYDKELSQYGDMSGITKSISEKKKFYKNATRIQEGITLRDNAKNAENFEKHSKLGGDIENPTIDEAYGGFSIGPWKPFAKDINNKVTYSRENYDAALEKGKASAGQGGVDFGLYGVNPLYKQMNDEEVAIYNYYLSKEGEEKADEFLNSITESLNYRQAETNFDEIYRNKPVLEALLGVSAGLDQWASGVKSLFNTDGEYVPQSATQMMSGMAREDLYDDFGAIGQGGYDLITTTANMLPSILVSHLTGGIGGAVGLGAKAAATAGKIAGAVTLGSSAAGNGYQEMLNLGYDKGQAQAYGTLVGISEAGLEYVLGGISSLGGKYSGGLTDKIVTKLVSNVDNAIAKVAIGAGGKLIGNMVSEFGEEYLQEVLDPVFKNITLHTDEDIKLFSAEALYSGILGALSAGLLEGGSTVSGEVATYKAGKDVKNTGQLSNLKKFGTSFSADTVAYKIASKVDENTDAYTIGQLLHEVGADSLSEANMADISKSLERKGIPAESAQKIAKWLDAAVQGEIFTPLQRLALKNPDISQTFKDVIVNQNSTVNQRMQSYNDVLMGIANEKANLQANKAATKAQKKTEKAEAKAETTEKTISTPFVPYSNEEIARRLASGEEINLGENKSTLDSKNALESKFEVNLDGQTVNTKTGDSVTVAEIASIENGKMKLKLDNGETVDAEDISFGTQDDAHIYTAVLDMGVNAAVANSLVKNFKAGEGVSADRYVLGIKEAFKYGSYSIPESEMSKKGFAADLSEPQRKLAYDLGRVAAAEKVEKAQAEAEKSGKGSVRGKVNFSGDRLKLNAIRRESLKRMDILSEALGVEFNVFESYIDKNGKRVFKDSDGKIKNAPNGYYQNGKIYIDLNAGKNGEGAMIYTVSHELTHFIKEWSPAKFKILADFLMEQYGKKGQSVSALIEAQIQKAERNGRTIDYDTAYEEVVADSMESMLNDDKVIEKIQLLKAKDKGLVAKIKEFFNTILEKLSNLLKDYELNSKEGRIVSNMKDAISELQNLFAEALVDASNNLQAPGQKNTTSEGDVIRLSDRDNSDNSIKDQLKTNVDLLNSMETVASVQEFKSFENKQKALEWVLKRLENTGYKVNRKGFGEIIIDKKRLKNGLSYSKTNAEMLAFAVLPQVLAKGVEIDVHLKHKGRAYDTVTFAAPVVINGQRGNMAAVVRQEGKNYYKVHRLVMPDGSQFILNKKRDIAETAGGVINNSGLSPADNVSKGSIPQTSKKSQEKLSGRDNSIGERNLEDYAEAKDTEGKTLFQYRAMEADEDIYREMLKTANIMNDTEIDSLFDTIDKAMDIIKDNLEVLDYAWEADIDDRAFSPVKKNTDKLYQVSVDFSTLCRKRLLQQTIQAHLQEALNRPLTRNEGIAIRDALMTIQEEGKKIEIACALCYVESARMKSPTQIKRFVDDRETVIKNYFASKSVEVKAQLKETEAKARKRLGADDTPLTKLPSKMQKEIRGAKKDVISSYVPSAKEQELIEIAKGMSVNDFVTPKGLENLIKKYPDLFDAYASFIVNATHSKGIENDTWWRAGDSKNIGDTLIANMNAENGLRSQSWSDFQVIHLLDYIAATIELSTRNAKMQAYTKVPDFVELMGNTGEMINLSLIPTRNFNGTLDFDGVEGMAFEESLRLRCKYHATVGTIAIGIDNVQIQMLLDSMDIDYVIPYHRSGMAKTVRKAMHIPTWTEYENYQSEKKLSREDAKRQAKKYGVKLLAESDSNYQQNPNFSDWFDIKEARQIAKMENSNPSDKAMQKKYGVMYGGYMAMQNAANNYLKLCAERGISPKFSHEKANFTVEDNYWKLLIDRKMIDNITGEVIEQQAVKPIFDQSEVLRILNDELERYPSVKADQDYAIRKVAEKFLSGEIKGGMSADAIAKVMKAPVDNVAKVNILASVEDAKLMDRDSEGNTLTKEQTEFFKDSKVRDSNGNLLVMYHGTSRGGHTVFDTYGSNYGLFGTGSYFTDNKEVAQSYTKKGKGNNPKVYESYLNITNPIDMDAQADIEAWGKALPDADFSDCKTNEDCYRVMEEYLEDEMFSKWEAAEYAITTIQGMGYDGIAHIGGGRVNTDGIRHQVYIAFEPEQIKETTNTNPTTDPDIRFSERVTDEETLDYLNEQIEKGEYIKVYRSFQVIDGGLYAPMNAVDRDENGKNKRLGYRSEYGVWEKSTESPEIAQRYMDNHPEAPYAKFDLDGVDNKTNAVAYNPYLHASNLVLNDQFAAAYRRNLITVECYVPLSEAKGEYKAQYAKDATGWVDWKAGGVAGKLLKVKPEYTRKLFVSRYMLPVRQVPDSEVAAMYKEYLDGTDIAVPWNVVTPSLRSELEKVGVAISYDDVKAGSKTISFNEVFSDEIKLQDRDAETAENIEKINKQLAKENLKLIEDVKYLKELVKLQGKETHGKMLKKSTVELVAKRLMAYSSAKGNVSELASYLTDVYNYIIQGEDVSWEGIQEKSQAAVDWLMQNEYHKPVRDEYANDVLKHLRTMRVSLDEKQKAEAAYYFGSYNDYRKKNMGRIIITNDGTPLDSAWQELAEMHPAYFDENVNASDQPIMLMEIIDGLQNSYIQDEYHYYSDDMIAQDLLTKIYEGYWDVSALHTVADAKQKEINILKANHKQRMDELRESHEKSDAKLRQEHREKISQLRTQYREREEKKVQKVAQYYQKSRKEAVEKVRETREKRDAITKLQRLVLDTANWVSYPTKDAVKCPDIIRGPYAEFLSSIDLSSKRKLAGGDPTLNDLRVTSAMDSLAKAIEKKLDTQNPDSETETVLDTGYLDLPMHFVDNLKELAEDLKKRMATDGHIVNSMTSDEIKALTKFIRTLNHSIKEMSTLYSNMRFARVEQLGNDTMVFLKDLGETKESSSIASFVTWDNALPYYTFKRFGTGGESVFEELMDSQDKLAALANEIFKFKEKTWTDKEASEWSKDVHEIELPSGKKLTLTSADAMSIYCLSRRDQGKQHLLGGGVRVLGLEKNGKKSQDSRSTLNQQDLLAIASSLDERQRKVAEAIQEFMSTVCSEWGNEISMKRFLTKEFTEKFYFPIESNDENLDTKDPKAQQSDLYRLLNISATKPLTKGANNEVIIRNIFDVFTNHSSDMAKLNAYGMALLDYMKWINYREKTTNDEGQISVSGVRKSMERAYGPEAKKYVIGLIKDINGRANDGGDHPFLMKMTRAAKTAMVGANLRVSLLQFTAYPRAAMVLSNKSLALGLTKMPQIEKAKKYCGIALWKSFGFYDTNISRSIEDQLKGTTNMRQKIIELSLKGAEWGDAITWGCLWNACEYEVAKTKQYKIGSEEFNQAVGKKLREVVYATQVVDSTLTRSQMMRNKSGLTQSASAFMSEPTLSANILMDAGFQFNLEKRRTGSAKLAWNKTKKHIGKAVAVYSIGQIFAALAEAIADAYRDDDDEEFTNKFGEAFKENVISDLNPFNKIPIMADISDVVLSWFGIGFSSSNSLYLTAIDEAKNAFDIWSKVINGEDGKTVYAGVYSTTKLLSYVTGVSASGAMREVVTLWNNTAGAADPYLKIRTYESSATDKGIAEYKFDKGDTNSVKTAVSKMVNDKIKSGKTEKEAKSAVRSSFTSTYKAEYLAAVKAKDYDEMNQIRKFLYATGLYGSLSELDETLKKWRTNE